MVHSSLTLHWFFNYQLNNINYSRICLTLFAGLLLFLYYFNGEIIKDEDIDYLILSERWIPSACISYKAKRYTNHCILPKESNIWALHGLWPQKGYSPGPFYCHPELVFDVSVLTPIIKELNLHWLNVYQGQSSESFWKHEWDKHGTCAVILPPLQDQIHFFNSTLSLFYRHNMNAYFKAMNVLPTNSGMLVSDLNYQLKRVLGRIIKIKCTEANGQHYLEEIRLCLNKNLELINCPLHGESITNCPADKFILYPNNVDETHKIKNLSNYDEEKLSYHAKIFKIWEIIKFLKWASL